MWKLSFAAIITGTAAEDGGQWFSTQRVLVDEGNAVGTFPNIPLKACQSICESRSNCHSLSYGDGNCYLKDKCVHLTDPIVPANAANANFVTWFMLCNGPVPPPSPPSPPVPPPSPPTPPVPPPSPPTPPVPPPPAPPVEKCYYEDRADPAWCAQQRDLGHCTANEYIFKCQRTCGYCNTTGPWLSCEDHAATDLCRYQRNFGGCMKPDIAMLCPASCGVCNRHLDYQPPSTNCRDTKFGCGWDASFKNSCANAGFRNQCKDTCQVCSSNPWAPEDPKCTDSWGDCGRRQMGGECPKNWCRDHCKATCGYCDSPKEVASGDACTDGWDTPSCEAQFKFGGCTKEHVREGCQKTCKWCIPPTTTTTTTMHAEVVV